MNGNLFGMEWSKNRKLLLVWALIIGAMTFLPLSFYRTLAENQKQFTDFFDILPKEALQMKGITNISDLFSVLGFYASSIAAVVMLLGGVYSIVLTSGILLKEETGKTAEFLLSKPLSRREVFLTKFALAFLNILLLSAFTTLAAWAALELFKTEAFNMKNFLILSFEMFLLNLLFGALGIFMSTLVKRPKPITVLSIGIVLISYFVYSLAKLSEKAAMLSYISPFKYVNTDVVNAAYRLEASSVIYFLGLSAAMALAALLVYRRKDILI